MQKQLLMATLGRCAVVYQQVLAATQALLLLCPFRMLAACSTALHCVHSEADPWMHSDPPTPPGLCPHPLWCCAHAAIVTDTEDNASR